jgi:hypothetical protein
MPELDIATPKYNSPPKRKFLNSNKNVMRPGGVGGEAFGKQIFL